MRSVCCPATRSLPRRFRVKARSCRTLPSKMSRPIRLDARPLIPVFLRPHRHTRSSARPGTTPDFRPRHFRRRSGSTFPTPHPAPTTAATAVQGGRNAQPCRRRISRPARTPPAPPTACADNLPAATRSPSAPRFRQKELPPQKAPARSRRRPTGNQTSNPHRRSPYHADFCSPHSTEESREDAVESRSPCLRALCAFLCVLCVKSFDFSVLAVPSIPQTMHRIEQASFPGAPFQVPSRLGANLE